MRRILIAFSMMLMLAGCATSGKIVELEVSNSCHDCFIRAKPKTFEAQLNAGPWLKYRELEKVFENETNSPASLEDLKKSYSALISSLLVTTGIAVTSIVGGGLVGNTIDGGSKQSFGSGGMYLGLLIGGGVGGLVNRKITFDASQKQEKYFLEALRKHNASMSSEGDER